MLQKLAARSLIRDFEEGTSYLHDKARPSSEAIKKEVVRLGTTFGLASRYTSFIAVEDRSKERSVFFFEQQLNDTLDQLKKQSADLNQLLSQQSATLQTISARSSESKKISHLSRKKASAPSPRMQPPQRESCQRYGSGLDDICMPIVDLKLSTPQPLLASADKSNIPLARADRCSMPQQSFGDADSDEDEGDSFVSCKGGFDGMDAPPSPTLEPRRSSFTLPSSSACSSSSASRPSFAPTQSSAPPPPPPQSSAPPPPFAPSQSSAPPPPSGGAAPSYAPVVAPSTAAPISKRDLFSSLIRLQQCDGSFELGAELSNALGLPLEKLTATNPFSGADDQQTAKLAKVWATLVCVKFIETKLADFKDEWELAVGKSLQWIKKTIKTLAVSQTLPELEKLAQELTK
eukprot:TRINITY_DN11297_c0_g1_i5.p1 TRINITY_DN11297_c0_g1~~TRINITY_DN11297_c0_g1_i5.p1  ORF type:complete len:404 (+),score=54.27 TRINITY_DN11297_c0_g1_i5:223-1434(+)